MHGKKVASSTAILETQAACNLSSTAVSIAAVVHLPCRASMQPGVQVRQ